MAEENDAPTGIEAQDTAAPMAADGQQDSANQDAEAPAASAEEQAPVNAEDASGAEKVADGGADGAADAPKEPISNDAPGLGAAIKEQLNALQHNFDNNVLNALGKLSEEDQQEILDKYKANDSVRNPEAFLMSLVRFVVENIAKSKTFEDFPEPVRTQLEGIFSDEGLTKEAFSDRCAMIMHTLPEELQLKAVEKYSTADRSAIQNLEGFFHSIARRLSNIQKRGSNGEPPAEVKARIAEAIASGIIKEGDLDDRCLEALSEYEAKDGLEMLENFFSSDLSNVRNMGGFFFGVVKRFRNRRGGGGGGRGRRGDRRGGGGRRGDRRRDRNDGYRGGYGRDRDDRRDYDRRDYDRSRDYDRGRDYDRSRDYDRDRDYDRNRGYERSRDYDRPSYDRPSYDRPSYDRPPARDYDQSNRY